MKFHQLQYLVAIADKGSVRSAAQQLGLSPAAVSRAVIELEDSLNTPLLLRTAQGAGLTDAGRGLLSHARTILGQLEEAAQVVNDSRREESQTLSIAATPWFAESLLHVAASRFRRLRPKVRLYFEDVLGSSHDGLRDGRVDVAFGTPPPADTAGEFREIKLCTFDSAVMCRKGHPLAGARSLSELAGATWILSRDAAAFPSPIREVLVAALDDPDDTRVHYARSHRIATVFVTHTDMLTVVPWPIVEVTEIRERNQDDPAMRRLFSVIDRLDASEIDV